MICFSLSAQVKEELNKNMTKKELEQQKKREHEEKRKKKEEEKRREEEEWEEKRRKEEERGKRERDKDLQKKHKVQITLSFQFSHFAVVNVQKYEHRNTGSSKKVLHMGNRPFWYLPNQWIAIFVRFYWLL